MGRILACIFYVPKSNRDYCTNQFLFVPITIVNNQPRLKSLANPLTAGYLNTKIRQFNALPNAQRRNISTDRDLLMASAIANMSTAAVPERQQTIGTRQLLEPLPLSYTASETADSARSKAAAQLFQQQQLALTGSSSSKTQWIAETDNSSSFEGSV